MLQSVFKPKGKTAIRREMSFFGLRRWCRLRALTDFRNEHMGLDVPALGMNLRFCPCLMSWYVQRYTLHTWAIRQRSKVFMDFTTWAALVLFLITAFFLDVIFNYCYFEG